MHVRDWLDEVTKTERRLAEAAPFKLDDRTLTRILDACANEEQDLRLFEEQLGLWLRGPLTTEERTSCDELTRNLGHIRGSIDFATRKAESLLGGGSEPLPGKSRLPLQDSQEAKRKASRH